MKDYFPVDLTAFCNSHHEILGSEKKPETGLQSYHGIPFQIGRSGDHDERCFIGCGDGLNRKTLKIPVNSQPKRILVLHRLLESNVYEGGAVGNKVAIYKFYFKDRGIIEVPIRERFEISVIPTGWGQLPFLAYPDNKDSLPPRYEGAWKDTGMRQRECIQSWPQDYYLWLWKSTRNDSIMEHMEVVPAGPKFIIAGITLGYLDEDVIPRSGARDVMIEMLQQKDSEKDFNIEVAVDRGVASFPYPLSKNDEDEFINDPLKGWGEERNTQSSPVYTKVSASRSATVTVSNSDGTIGEVNWGELEDKKILRPNDRLHIEIIDSGKNWIRTTVVDDETEQQLPCRIHFRSKRGVPYAPQGHHSEVCADMDTLHMDVGGDLRLGQISYAYIDGKCQGWLPREEVIVDIARGYEYEPIRKKVTINAEDRELTFRLKRWCDMNKERYFSGDTHVHFLSTQGAHIEAQGENLNVVNLLLSRWGNMYSNTEEFIGGPNISPNGKSIVYASQENRQHILGHLSLLGLKEQVFPLCTDGPSESEIGGILETTLSHWADECHTQGGTVILPHIPLPNGEPATLIATGRVDAVEYLTDQYETEAAYGFLEYYRYLNCGYRLPLVGGTDKMSSNVPVGVYRTYVHIPEDEEFNYSNWCKNLKLGNTFFSGGPIIRFQVEGKPIGSTIQLPVNGGTVEVEAIAESIFPVHSLEIIQEGRVVASTGDSKGTRKLRINAPIKIARHSWLAARCGGPQLTDGIVHHEGWKRGIIAHTSPVYIAVGGDWWMHNEATINYMRTLVEGSLSYIRNISRRYKHDTVTYHHHENDHQAYLERPFQQALQALHKRMHQLGIKH